MFDEAATDVENELVQTSNSGMTYFAEQKFGRLEHKMDHLACFGGMYIQSDFFKNPLYLNSRVGDDVKKVNKQHLGAVHPPYMQ